MKKLLFFSVLLLGATLIPQNLRAQSTEGTDFWVTFMRACDNNPTNLMLKIAAKQTAKVQITNSFAKDTIDTVVQAGTIVTLQNLNLSLCYVADNEDEIVSNNALRIKSDKTISVIAANYRDKSFDVAAIMPAKALKSEHYIQCYSPSSHKEDGKPKNPQGTHFAIVAAENNTVVDFVPTVKTKKMWDGTISQGIGDTITTPVMQAGQVYYVWTGGTESGRLAEGDDFDFSGTWVKARNKKKIAVFNGAPHTNIPYDIRDRDHIYSQAMPTVYWGTQFAVTSSLTTIDEATGTWERLDKVRVMALEDGTAVIINGDTAHVFDFVNGDADDKKHFYEFEFGIEDSKSVWQTDPLRPSIKRIKTTNCFIETTCPAAVHLFMTSNQYDHAKDKSINTKYCNGDPSQIWINPIEQRITDLTFGNFQTTQVKDHFLNIITLNETSNLNSIKLDNVSKGSAFTPMVGNSNYAFARLKIEDGTIPHTLTADSGFIAHVYGFGEKESYGYPAGGNTLDLTEMITVDSVPLDPDVPSLICRSATQTNDILFTCTPHYPYKAITWHFGDGTVVTGADDVDTIVHTYPKDDIYNGFVEIEHTTASMQKCGSKTTDNLIDTFPMIINLERLQLKYEPVKDKICSNSQDFRIYYECNHDLSSANISKKYDAKAIAAGFTDDPVNAVDEEGKTYFKVAIPNPNNIQDGETYSIEIELTTDCGKQPAKTIPFRISYTNRDILAQRWENTIAAWTPEEMMNNTKSSIDWSKKSIHFNNYAWFQRDTTGTSRDYTWMPAETESFLLRERVPENHEFYVDIYYSVYDSATNTFSQDTISSCPIAFAKSAAPDMFEADSTIIELGDIVVYRADRNYMLVMSAQDGEAKWINSQGSTVASADVRAGGSMVALPPENGLYILRVIVGKNKKNMKVMVY